MHERGALQPTVADVALDPIACLAPTASVAQVARVLTENRQGAVVLLSEPFAVVTQHDVVHAIAVGADPDLPALDIQHEGACVIAEQTPLADTLQLMLDHDHSSVVVVDAQDRIIGFVTMRRVVDALLSGPPWVGALRLALHIEGRTP
jgi:CBS domain-containing protein